MSGAGRPGGTTVDAAGLSLAIAATRWHAEITDTLVHRAVAERGLRSLQVQRLEHGVVRNATERDDRGIAIRS